MAARPLADVRDAALFPNYFGQTCYQFIHKVITKSEKIILKKEKVANANVRTVFTHFLQTVSLCHGQVSAGKNPPLTDTWLNWSKMAYSVKTTRMTKYVS